MSDDPVPACDPLRVDELYGIERGGGGVCERLAARATYWAGTSGAFVGAAGLLVLWLVVGPYFHYSDTWQLVVNTGTTIITFLMVFLIQRAQNRETLALKIQLAELIASLKDAHNTVIDLDDLSEVQLTALHRRYQELSRTPIVPSPIVRDPGSG